MSTHFFQFNAGYCSVPLSSSVAGVHTSAIHVSILLSLSSLPFIVSWFLHFLLSCALRLLLYRVHYSHQPNSLCGKYQYGFYVLHVSCITCAGCIHYNIPRYNGNRRLRNLISARSPELLSWPVRYYQYRTDQILILHRSTMKLQLYVHYIVLLARNLLAWAESSYNCCVHCGLHYEHTSLSGRKTMACLTLDIPSVWSGAYVSLFSRDKQLPPCLAM